MVKIEQVVHKIWGEILMSNPPKEDYIILLHGLSNNGNLYYRYTGVDIKSC
jgi:hypothetical protein